MRGTILIVDDEKHTREGLRQSLEDDFDIYTAGCRFRGGAQDKRIFELPILPDAL